MSSVYEQHRVDIELAELVDDPYPILEYLRQNQPVAWVPSLEMWLVTRWDDVVFINTHPELFTAETNPSFLADALGPNMLTLEGEPARRLKEAMLPPFLPKGRAGTYVSEQMTGIADQLIDRFIDDGHAEIVAAYATPFSTIALQQVLGLDNMTWEELWEDCLGVVTGIANWGGAPEKLAIAEKAKRRLNDRIREKIEQVQAHPDHSGISHMVHLNEAALTPEEIVNNVRLMISGGINEPRDGIGLVLWALFRHSEAYDAVMADPRLWPKVVNEVFRLYAPVGTSTRMTTQDTVLAGVLIPAGDLVSAALNAANRDESQFENPTLFDIHRKGSNLAFANGQHRCLGAWLGFEEVHKGARRLFERLPNLRPIPDMAISISGFEFRGPEELHVMWGN